jgi:hypothetical protein
MVVQLDLSTISYLQGSDLDLIIWGTSQLPIDIKTISHDLLGLPIDL